MKKLSGEELYRQCDPDQFQFETTADLKETTAIVGQNRAVDAVQFGIGIQQEGYNLFALGPHGIGKYSAVRRFLEKRAAKMFIISSIPTSREISGCRPARESS